MPDRTSAEWRELMEKLQGIVDDPKETTERKRKAQNILDGITRPHGLSPTAALRQREGTQRNRTEAEVAAEIELDYSGEIV